MSSFVSSVHPDGKVNENVFRSIFWDFPVSAPEGACPHTNKHVVKNKTLRLNALFILPLIVSSFFRSYHLFSVNRPTILKRIHYFLRTLKS